MSKNPITLLTLLLMAFVGANRAFAIMGLGFHGGMDLSTKVKGVDRASMDLTLQNIGDSIVTKALNTALDTMTNHDMGPKFTRTDFKELYNLGPKFYLDALPIIDLEVTTNISFKDYKFWASYPNLQDSGFWANLSDTAFLRGLASGTDSIPLQALDTMTFAYLRVATDLTIRRTFLKLPPVIKLLRLYVGAGPSFVAATPLVDEKFFEEVLNAVMESQGMTASPADFRKVLLNQLTKEAGKIKFKMAGHVMFGFQVKPPVVPIAIYADGKLYFGLPKKGGTQSTAFIANAGLALAF